MSGEQQVTIDRVEMGTGWVCFEAGQFPPAAEDLPNFLNDALSQWLQRNPEFRVRATLPVCAGGHTAAIHVWFD